uniref:Partitioning defective 6 homolog beta n=1 Tax=Rhabditophanes sp. KR3021 TaxID=114890 RepID=A0AC35U0E3_9BILA
MAQDSDNIRSPTNYADSSPSSIGAIHTRTQTNRSGNSATFYQSSLPVPANIAVKSKFDAEFRRFLIHLEGGKAMPYNDLRKLLEDMHFLQDIPFTICYTSTSGDILPITNDENFRKSYESAKPCLRILIQRKGESWEEKYGYGTESMDRKKKGLSTILPVSQKPQRSILISNPEDFRQVSAIIDVDIIPDTQRRVRLCKHGSDRPLGFFIREGDSMRLSNQGVRKVKSIFISKLLQGGLAESTGLLAINDEILEVNGISVDGKTLDQVTDMMVANAGNLIITVKPANQSSLNRNPSGNISHRTNSNSSFSVGEMHESRNNKTGEYIIKHKKTRRTEDDSDSSDGEMYDINSSHHS